MNAQKYTPQEIQSAREYAAELPMSLSILCFDDDFGFASHVTEADKKAYSQSKVEQSDAILKGEKDGNLAVAQRMVYFLTGESKPLMNC